MREQEEIFKEIPGYEKYYASNFGNIKSLKQNKERILKPNDNTQGYLYVNLSKNNISKSKMVHVLIAITFLDHKPDGTHKIVVDHIDNNKSNNNLSNLRLTTQRENSIKNKLSKSGYTGVYESRDKKKWVSRIVIGRKYFHLGTFDTGLEAHNRYLKACESLKKDKDVV